ncbi:GNAT family N-acetyltransferase [Ktedonobacter racemifer]|uniref:GCN5-related N-acetyltransferase n=1 Tax=Ktedonobacter racemifer DSM 44963 TaxID=485913 RepID=D6U1V0_KTERA|nr:GNAT family N-acetyltransferase [Ktedonobacter racemifer]EFH80834.1 GCN5-related N-acetyltransferase [Ktedonobacter racemifer DSM 44963]
MIVNQRLQEIGQERLRLAPATRDDFEAVATLFAALHAYNASLNAQFALADGWQALLREHFLRTHESEGTFWLLAWKGQRPVGLLLLENHLDSPLFRHRAWVELVALYVDPDVQGAGLAQCLMEEAKNWTAQHGASHMQLYVTAQNARAKAFYRHCGWQPIQEIWSLALSAEPNSPSLLVDPSCDGELLNNGHHHLALKTHTQEDQARSNIYTLEQEAR